MERAIAVSQITVGIISAAASTTMAFFVARSGEQLTKPFRRIIFGLSISDVLQSSSLVFAPLAAQSAARGDCGGVTYCNISASGFLIGAYGVIFYTLGLCVYYLYIVKYNFSDQEFARKREPGIHAAAILVPSIAVAILASTESFNPSVDGNGCFFFDKPFGCHLDPDVECVRGANAHILGMYAVIGPFLLFGAGITVALFKLCRTVISQDRLRRSRFRSAMLAQQDGIDARANSTWPVPEGTNISQNLVISSSRLYRSLFRRNREEEYLTRDERLASQRSKETMHQSLLYVGAYCITYSCSVILYLAFYWQGSKPPRIFVFVAVTLFPIGGLLNILVYTRPKVSTVQRRYECSWLRAFWEVFKAGGEVPSHISVINRHRSTYAESQLVNRQQQVDNSISYESPCEEADQRALDASSDNSNSGDLSTDLDRMNSICQQLARNDGAASGPPSDAHESIHSEGTEDELKDEFSRTDELDLAESTVEAEVEAEDIDDVDVEKAQGEP